ncbi:MAG: phosphoenolpyruvate--protein phosphotransferase [Acidobacteria bacterium]|nr:phosphoenolpyruvate--protein phosphotransferase [Acidobacteriota bacterium]
MAAGRLYRIEPAPSPPEENRVPPARIGHECERFRRALRLVRQQLRRIRQRLDLGAGRERARLIDAQLLMLGDRYFTAGVERVIRTQSASASCAVRLTSDPILRATLAIEDAYLRDRSREIQDVAQRLILALSEKRSRGQREIPADAILLAEDLPISVLAEWATRGIRAFATGSGGWTSHTSILARSLAIPALAGLDLGHRSLQTGAPAVLDGDRGVLQIHPPTRVVLRAAQGRARELKGERDPSSGSSAGCVTRDGRAITLRANLSAPMEARDLRRVGAEGIGLVRSEYLALLSPRRRLDEEAQVDVYGKLVRQVRPFSVTVRLYDPPSIQRLLAIESTACGAPEVQPEGLATAEPACWFQLRVLLRAGAFGSLRVLVPKVTSVKQIREVRAALERVAEELDGERIARASSVKLGSMIETIDAVAAVGRLAREVDFFSLGTNDLIPEVLGQAREHPVAQHRSMFHPGVLRTISRAIHAARRGNIPLETCGEAAGQVPDVLMMVGLGLSSLSMTPRAIPRIRAVLQSTDWATARRVAERALQCRTIRQVEELVREAWPDHPLRAAPCP